MSLLYQFQGIFGAVLGAVATLIVTQILRNIGRLRFYPQGYDLQGIGTHKEQDGSSKHEIINDFRAATRIEYSIYLQIYNGAESMKAIKDVLLEFKLPNKTLGIRPEKRFGADYSGRRQVLYLNLPAKQITELELEGQIYLDDAPELVQFNDLCSIYLTYTTPKDKKKKQLIWKRPR